jgi:glycosyltransferase involved in cell wall biosynthesis
MGIHRSHKQAEKGKESPSLCFIAPRYEYESFFIIQDVDILRHFFTVYVCRFKSAAGFRTAASMIKQLFQLPFPTYRSHALFIWFADYHALIPMILGRLFRKPVFLVLGGYDTTWLPEYAYGVFTNPLRTRIVLYLYHKSACVLPVSDYAAAESKKRSVYSGRVIYNAIVFPDVQLGKLIPEKNLILTVGYCNTPRRYFIKGFDRFIQMARMNPEYPFMIIGVEQSFKDGLSNLPDNLTILTPQPHEALAEYYEKTSVYCQFSRFESFGMGVAEACATGALPLLSSAGALPEMVNHNTDYIIEDFDEPEEGRRKIQSLYSKNYNKREECIRKLKEKYSLEVRKNALKSIFIEKGLLSEEI